LTINTAPGDIPLEPVTSPSLRLPKTPNLQLDKSGGAGGSTLKESPSSKSSLVGGD
jgi:hypothetical protein